jgi:uncharacterized protein (DUF2249 family)
MLSLDLSRLKKLVEPLGRGHDGGFTRRDRLRRINRGLGEWLAAGGTNARSVMMQSVVEADAILPAEMKRTIGPLQAAESDQLRQKGCLDLGQMLNAGQAAEVVAHLSSKPLLIGRSPGRSQGETAAIAGVPRDQNYASYGYLDLWSSPHLLEFATQDRLLDLAQGYLDCAPTLSALNAYWALPERLPEPDLQAFHRDLDDCRSLTIFTLLTPVDVPEEGVHFYVEKSHDPSRLEESLRADGVGTKIDYLLTGPFVAPMAMRLFNRSARRFYGPAGSSFCADAYGLHRFVVPRSSPKLLLELRFGTYFNEHVYDMKLDRDSDARRILRRALAPALRIGGLFDRTRREQARRTVRRIPETARHQYVFRYMIDELSAEL